jgi:hypothetical protein
MKTKKESLTCQSKKSLSRETPEVRIRMSSGGDADVYKFREMFSSVMSLLYRQGQSGTGKRGERDEGDRLWIGSGIDGAFDRCCHFFLRRVRTAEV